MISSFVPRQCLKNVCEDLYDLRQRDKGAKIHLPRLFENSLKYVAGVSLDTLGIHRSDSTSERIVG